MRRILEENEVPHVWYGWSEQIGGIGGGCDIRAGKWAIEVKRSAKGRFQRAWMKQAEAAAERAPGCASPAVVYRGDRMPWRVRTLEDDMDLDAWIEREKGETL